MLRRSRSVNEKRLQVLWLTEQSIARIVSATGRTTDDARAAIARRNPQNRLIDPEEVATAVAYLCGPSAAGVNGTTLVIDGGELRLSCTYSREVLRAEVVEAFLESYRRELTLLVEHCLSGARGVTPSDFPLAPSPFEQCFSL